MKRIISYISFFSFLFFLVGCSDLSRENQRFADLVTRVKTRYAPDRKLAIFEITTKRTNKGIALIGEVDNAEAKEALIDAISPLVKKITDSITVLPDARLAGQSRGIVCVSVANMRGDPVESAELVSQATMGSVVKVLKENSGWYYVQTPDKYLGWMKGDAFVLCNKEDADAWIAARKVIVLSTYETVRQDAHPGSYPVCDLVAGSLVKNVGGASAWTNVQMPDGRTGFVPNGSVADYKTWKKNTKPTPDGIERTARSLLGVPYLWGGTSTKAMDCSGFTKTVYFMNGVQLNRDAYQQAQQGIDVPPGEKFENLRKGDLLFFGRKGGIDKPEEILHVALYLKDRLFIHSSGMVKINSLDAASSVFDPNKVKSFICARRLLPAQVSVSEAAFRR
ncbi:MAG: NlpC/P60 family protein [Bacteroidota bacterium]